MAAPVITPTNSVGQPILWLFSDDPKRKVLIGPKITYTFLAADATAGDAFVLTSALWIMCTIVIPTATNVITFTLDVYDSVDDETSGDRLLFSHSALALSTTYQKVPVVDSINWSVPVNNLKIRLTPSGAPGAGGCVVKVIPRMS
jgi:hypothetical protein